MRLQEQIFKVTGRPYDPDMNGQLAANWVNSLAEVVTDPLTPAEWPEGVVFDSTSYEHGKKAKARLGKHFNVLVAVGFEEDETKGKIWLIEPSPRRTWRDWARFFRMLEGEPRVITTDMDKALTRAIREVFPNAEHRICEKHLMQTLEPTLHPDFAANRRHPVTMRIRSALASPGGWANFKAAVLHEYAYGDTQKIRPTHAWLYSKKARIVERQVQTRTLLGPNSTGAAEGVIKKLDAYLYGRAQNMTNRDRARKLLRLIQAGLNGQADELAWADQVRAYLAARGGWPATRQRGRHHEDPAGTWSLLS